MSSIIDDLIFCTSRCQEREELSRWRNDEQVAFRNFSKKLNPEQGPYLLAEDQQTLEIANKINVQDRVYTLRMTLSNRNRFLKVAVRELNGTAFRHISSGQNQLLFLKEFIKWQLQEPRESVFYIKRGYLVMLHQVHFCISQTLLPSRLNDFYNLVLTRAMTSFNQFVGQHWDRVGNFSLLDSDNCPKNNHQEILISQLLNTTSTTFDSSEDSSQFKEVEAALMKKSEDLMNLHESIVDESPLQVEIGRFFQSCPVGSEWVKGNLGTIYRSCQKKLAGLLSMSKFVGEKRIDDYIFNTVKIQVKEVMSRPFSAGGSCYLFISKANINYISSLDSTSYFMNEERKDRVLAMKKLKPELGKKFAHKLEHEKNIVTKLKGGCSYFIPKYYRMETALDPSDTLFMEYIQGEELDFYMLARSVTISLWTKICLLLNVVHGLRYLNSYNIVHLDVKPINVLVCRQLITKIIDYGEAYHKDICPPNYAPGYTFPYVAPEVFARFEQDPEKRSPTFQYSQKQDVFAIGLILMELLFNDKVYNFSNNKFREVYSKAETMERFFLNCEHLTTFGDYRVILHLLHMVVRCLDPDPSRRPKLDWIAVTLKLILNLCTA